MEQIKKKLKKIFDSLQNFYEKRIIPLKGVLVSLIAAAGCVILMGWAITSCDQNKSAPQSNETRELRIGAIFTLTGGTALWSEHLQRGIDIAVAEENKEGMTPIRVIYEDVQGQAQQAAAAFQKLSESERASVILSVFTPVSQPLRPLADNAQLPLLVSVVSVRDFGKESSWAFRDFPTQEQMAAPLGTYAVKTLGKKTAAALVVNDDYGSDGARAFSESFKQAGGQWLGEETFAQKDTDIRAQSAKIASFNPDAVIVVGRDQSLALAMKQLREAGFKGQFLSVNCLDEPSVWEIAGNAVDDAIFTSAFVDLASNEAAREFTSKYRNRYNSEPSYVVVYGYTIMKYLTPILRESGGDRAKIRQALETLNVDSLRGNLHTAPNHDILSPVAVFKVAGGKKEMTENPTRLAEIAGR